MLYSSSPAQVWCGVQMSLSTSSSDMPVTRAHDALACTHVVLSTPLRSLGDEQDALSTSPSWAGHAQVEEMSIASTVCSNVAAIDRNSACLWPRAGRQYPCEWMRAGAAAIDFVGEAVTADIYEARNRRACDNLWEFPEVIIGPSPFHEMSKQACDEGPQQWHTCATLYLAYTLPARVQNSLVLLRFRQPPATEIGGTVAL